MKIWIDPSMADRAVERFRSSEPYGDGNSIFSLLSGGIFDDLRKLSAEKIFRKI